MQKIKYFLEKNNSIPILNIKRQYNDRDVWLQCPYNETSCGDYCPHFNITNDFSKDEGRFNMGVKITCSGIKVILKIENPEILKEEGE